MCVPFQLKPGSRIETLLWSCRIRGAEGLRWKDSPLSPCVLCPRIVVESCQRLFSRILNPAKPSKQPLTPHRPLSFYHVGQSSFPSKQGLGIPVELVGRGATWVSWKIIYSLLLWFEWDVVHILSYLNTWFPVTDAVWGSLVGMVLLVGVITEGGLSTSLLTSLVCFLLPGCGSRCEPSAFSVYSSCHDYLQPYFPAVVVMHSYPFRIASPK